MSTLPEPVQPFADALKKLAGVRGVSIGLRALDGLRLPGEFGDLPHAAIRCTKRDYNEEKVATFVKKRARSFGLVRTQAGQESSESRQPGRFFT